MPAPELISGAWVGWYTYSDGARKYPTCMTMWYGNQMLVGEGMDVVGIFVIQGKYHLPTREVWWTKSYVRKHSVEYSGVRVGKHIEGTWSIRRYTGGFRIWPLGLDGEYQAEFNQQEQPIEEEAEQPRILIAKP